MGSGIGDVSHGDHLVHERMHVDNICSPNVRLFLFPITFATLGNLLMNDFAEMVSSRGNISIGWLFTLMPDT